MALLFQSYAAPVILSKCTVEDVCNLLEKLKGINSNHVKGYQASIRDNNVSGLVLSMCDLSELQPIIGMRFGDWQLFRSAINALISSESQQAAAAQGENVSDKADTSFNVQPVPSSQSNTAMSYSEAFSSGSTRRNPSTRSMSLQESGSVRYTPELQKIRERKMRRNDSIVEQLTYETAILKSAVSGFVEESEEEEEGEEEGQVAVLENLEELDGENIEEAGGGRRRAVFLQSDDSFSSPSSQPVSPGFPPAESLTFTISGGAGSLDSTSGSFSGASEHRSGSQVISGATTQVKSDKHLSSDSLSGISSSSRKVYQAPLSFSDIAPYIKVLDAPKKSMGPQGSGEFVPLLGSVQVHPSPPGSSEFVPEPEHPSPSLDLQLDIHVNSEPDIPASTSSDISALQGTISTSFSQDQHSQLQQPVAVPRTATSVPDNVGHGNSPNIHHQAHDAAVHLSRALAIDKSDSETTSEVDQSSPTKRPVQSISTSLERLTRPIIGHFRQHFHQTSFDEPRRESLPSFMTSLESEPFIELSSRSSPEKVPDHEDFVQHSYSTIVEMHAAVHEPDPQTDFHHELGTVFANMDLLPGSEHSSPDRETNV